MESSKSSETDQQHLVLESDLLCEICSRMPAKAAIKFSSLSKSLTSLLSDPFFVKRQSIHSSLFDGDGGFFLLSPFPPKKLEFHVLPSKGGELPSSSLGIPGRSLSFLQQFGRLLASSQGLVLVKSENDRYGPDRFLICNPATGSCALLPVPNEPLKSKPFINDNLLLVCHPRSLESCSSSNYFPTDYTIIAPLFWDDPDEDATDWVPSVTDFAVYRNGKWEEDTCHLKIEGHQLRTEMPVAIFRGCDRGLIVHYLCDSDINFDGPSYSEPFMVAYDFERKAHSRTFKLPKGAWNSSEDYDIGSVPLKIFGWRSLGGETVGLARMDKRMFRVWALEDYDRGRWKRVFCKSETEMGVPMKDSNALDCCVVNGTRLLFATWRRVYVYEMDGTDASRLKVVAEDGHKWFRRLAIIPYANTLRPVCATEGGSDVFSLGDL